MKFVKWVTLTPEEREAVGGGVKQSGSRIISFPALKEHTFTVVLTNGAECAVNYIRYGTKSHRYQFGSPVCQRIWHSEPLAGGVNGIEEKGRELAPQAFRLAQQAEQKEMRRKTPPTGTNLKSQGVPQLNPKSADSQAGLYSVCLRHSSGMLVPLGTCYEEPEKASHDLQSGAHRQVTLYGEQRIVVGICCRYTRQWKEPSLIALPVKPPEPEEPEKPVNKPTRRTRKPQ
ncbi:MAG: hypothetical protein NT023_03325 [Armatimonadetes bacterium]|nr:hypothetical protein [Armatimonadota bacterium]